ncbi:nitrate- and nitrite sensing domain-containing protein, partial [Sphaerisporangium rufum]|uniref:nitrate- and nitrite sensing domain-containing protein n=1 Tax=Sphaerisporangium rufum TaxID=1381558 RepID=UPI001951BFCA
MSATPQPIRSKLLRILLLPLISMVALWGVIAYSSAEEIATISQTQNRWEVIGAPVLQLITEFQRERQLSAEAPGSTGYDKSLGDQRQITDRTVTRVRQVIDSVTDADEAPERVRALVTALDTLTRLRQDADSGRLSPRLRVLTAYDELIDAAYMQFTEGDALSSTSSYRTVRGMSFYSSSAEYLARQHAVLTSSLVRGRMSPTERAAFIAGMAGRRIAIANSENDMGPELRVRYDDLLKSFVYRRLLDVESKVFSSDTAGALPVEPSVWRSDARAILDHITRDTEDELARAEAQRDSDKVAAYWRIGLIVGLGLAAIVVSILLSYRFGRSLVGEL